jgi:hypothetical protein
VRDVADRSLMPGWSEPGDLNSIVP